jgi:hypothetical protein
VILYGRAFFRARLPVARARLRVYGLAFALACDLRRKTARILHDGILVDNFPALFVFVRFRGISRGVLIFCPLAVKIASLYIRAPAYAPIHARTHTHTHAHCA